MVDIQDDLYKKLPYDALNSVGLHEDLPQFKAVGATAKKLLTVHAGLLPTHHLLDIGCGIGRMAIPLVDYLAEGGAYDGFDITPFSIDWCRREIASKHANFNFHFVDIHNSAYHPAGKLQGTSYIFPFADSHFDVAMATSVFTHMLVAETRQYLQQAARVLKPGGRFLASFFLLNQEVLRSIDAGKSTINFEHQRDGCWVNDDKIPESAVAYDTESIFKILSDSGFELVFQQFGGWSGRPVVG